MQIRLRGLHAGLDLETWEKRPFTAGSEDGPRERDHADQYEREVGREHAGPPEPDGAFRRVEAAIMRYEIFPPALVSGAVRRAPVQPGDTVGIVYHARLGIDLLFAARVIDCFDEEVKGGWRSGFTYRTLDGHPELGEETFAVLKNTTTGAVRVALDSWSRPGIWLAHIFSPIVRRLQIGASAAALNHLTAVAATVMRVPSGPGLFVKGA